MDALPQGLYHFYQSLATGDRLLNEVLARVTALIMFLIALLGHVNAHTSHVLLYRNGIIKHNGAYSPASEKLILQAGGNKLEQIQKFS